MRVMRLTQLLAQAPHQARFALGQPGRFLRLSTDRILMAVLVPSIGRVGAFLVRRIQSRREVSLVEMPSGRIGHFIMDTCFTALQIDADSRQEGATASRGARRLALWFAQAETANPTVSRIWRRNLRVVPRWIGKPTQSALLKEGRHDIARPCLTMTRPASLLLSRPGPQHWLTTAEIRQCQRVLGNNGVAVEQPWVCLHVRESSYEEHLHHRPITAPNYRNGSPAEIALAAVALAERGYTVFRMGTHMRQRLEVDHPRVIDYAHSRFASPMLDVYLGGGCTFFVSSGSGVDALAGWRWRPQVYLNLVLPSLVRYGFWNRSLLTFQTPREAGTGRALSLAEWAPRQELFLRHGPVACGVELERNSAELVRAVVLEMLDLTTTDHGAPPGPWPARDPNDPCTRTEAKAFSELVRHERIVMGGTDDLEWADALHTTRQLARLSQAWLTHAQHPLNGGPHS